MFMGGALADAATATCNTRAIRVNCPRANLYGVDFSGRNLVGANFKNANLERAVFRNANLTGANLIGAKLDNAIFTAAILDRAKIRGGNFRGIKSMRGAKVDRASFDQVFRVDFTGSKISDSAFIGNVAGAKFVNVAFSKYLGFTTAVDDSTSSVGSMQGTNFTGATFNLSDADYTTALKGAVGLTLPSLLPTAESLNLSEMDLTGVDLRSTRLRTVHLTNANLTNADVSGLRLCNSNSSPVGAANITGLIAVGSTIGNCSFAKTLGSPSTFANAQFRFTDLSNVRWESVNLSGTTFTIVKLTGASLRNSNLSRASRALGDMTGADFTGSIGASSGFWQLGASYTCPNGSVTTTGC